jgi:hypothetical protein
MMEEAIEDDTSQHPVCAKARSRRVIKPEQGEVDRQSGRAQSGVETWMAVGVL